MYKRKVSITIPYFRRIQNLELVLSALSRQDAQKSDFEVVIGAMEYCNEYVSLCKKYESDVNIITVMSSAPWRISTARNMAIKQANGEVVVMLDADIMLPRDFVTNLYQSHFSWGQKQCVIGQMVDYDNNNSDVDHVDAKSFSHYLPNLKEIEGNAVPPKDMRLHVGHNIPYAFTWTALIALPAKSIAEYDLYFNEEFYGYGVEDLEWGYRISQAGLPITLKQDVWGFHLPHVRNVKKNRETEFINYRRFLKKAPELTVELMSYYGDFEANGHYPEIKKMLSELAPDASMTMGVGLFIKDDKSVLVAGLPFDEKTVPDLNDVKLELTQHHLKEHFPLIGLKLPFDDNMIDIVSTTSLIDKLPPELNQSVHEELKRICKQ